MSFLFHIFYARIRKSELLQQNFVSDDWIDMHINIQYIHLFFDNKYLR